LQDRKRADGVVERVRAHLAEVSLVTFGAYGMAAAVAGIREQSQTPNLDAAREILEGLK
jgi:phage head maturation protease